VYGREIEGKEYTFGVSGKLIRNVLVMYDRQTSSYWSQLLGEAVEGELQGTKLEFMPSWMTTWEDWHTQYPDTLALDKGGFGSVDSYSRGYYNTDAAGVIGETLSDDRLDTKAFIIGVELDNASVAYPASELQQQPVINDNVGDDALLVVFDPATASGIVFDRTVDGQELTFSVVGDGQTLLDAETGSTWVARTGIALDGPLAGTRLEHFKSTRSFWFGWKDFHPDTIVYGSDD
jgi:hypothetical protein